MDLPLATRLPFFTETVGENLRSCCRSRRCGSRSLSESRERMVSEIADLVFHVSVLMADEGIEWAEIEDELERRK
jgi:hypothetical protein